MLDFCCSLFLRQLWLPNNFLLLLLLHDLNLFGNFESSRFGLDIMLRLLDVAVGTDARPGLAFRRSVAEV